MYPVCRASYPKAIRAILYYKFTQPFILRWVLRRQLLLLLRAVISKGIIRLRGVYGRSVTFHIRKYNSRTLRGCNLRWYFLVQARLRLLSRRVFFCLLTIWYWPCVSPVGWGCALWVRFCHNEKLTNYMRWQHCNLTSLNGTVTIQNRYPVPFRQCTSSSNQCHIDCRVCWDNK